MNHRWFDGEHSGVDERASILTFICQDVHGQEWLTPLIQSLEKLYIDAAFHVFLLQKLLEKQKGLLMRPSFAPTNLV